jgi:AraC-like DNA-binding protein
MYVRNLRVQALRTVPADLVRTRRVAPWGIRFPESNEISFHWLVEGPLWLRSSSYDLLPLAPGDLIIFPPHGTAHETMHGPKSPVKTLAEEWEGLGVPRGLMAGETTVQMCGSRRLEDQLYTPAIQKLPPFLHIPGSRVRTNSSLMTTFFLLNQELETPLPESENLIPQLLDLLLIYSIRESLRDSAIGRMECLSIQKDRALEKALMMIHSDPSSHWTLKDLSRRAGLSRATFSRRFKEEMGEPPLGYLKHYRMRLAGQMLLNSDASLAEVAQRVGYESAFAFSSSFKRVNGVSPSEFRRVKGRKSAGSL